MKNTVIVTLACFRFLSLSAAAESPSPAGWKLDFALEDRVRAEYRDNFDLKSSVNDAGGLIYQRLKLSAKASFGGKYELFAEGLDLRVANREIPKTAQDDAVDLHQAYAAVKKAFGLPLELKAGRQELKYAAGRLLWAATWSNRINHFDAAVLKYKAGGLSADAFYGSRVSYDANGWNDPNRHDRLAGAYVSYRKGKEAPLLEGYFLSNYDSSNMSTLNRRTVGVRGQFTLPGSVVCDLEVPYQSGRSSRKSVSARAFHLDLSREFKGAWSPKAAAAYNYASGDKKASDSVNNTFLPLYQSTHDPYGLMDLFRWQNMKEAALEFSVKPAKNFKLTAGTSYFWLAQGRDSWYDSSGKKLRTSAAGTAGTYVGQEVSLTAKGELGGGAGLEGGYAHFYSGAFVNDTGAQAGPDWLYFQLSVKI